MTIVTTMTIADKRLYTISNWKLSKYPGYLLRPASYFRLATICLLVSDIFFMALLSVSKALLLRSVNICILKVESLPPLTVASSSIVSSRMVLCMVVSPYPLI